MHTGDTDKGGEGEVKEIERPGPSRVGLLHIHTGLKSVFLGERGERETRKRRERESPLEEVEEPVPIIHDTVVEQAGVRPAPLFCLHAARETRSFADSVCLLSRLPQIRFVSGTRCSDYQAEKKNKKRKKKKEGG